MAYPGLIFALIVWIGIGTAIYFFFKKEHNQPQPQNQYAYDGDYADNDYTSNYNLTARSTSSGFFRRRRRNSKSTCSICLDDIGKSKLKTLSGCGHKFHENCITMWLNEQRICPNCRQPVYT